MENKITKTITLQIDLDLFEQLEKIAEEEDRSISSVIRLAIKNLIKSKHIENEVIE